MSFRTSRICFPVHLPLKKDWNRNRQDLRVRSATKHDQALEASLGRLTHRAAVRPTVVQCSTVRLQYPVVTRLSSMINLIFFLQISLHPTLLHLSSLHSPQYLRDQELHRGVPEHEISTNHSERVDFGNKDESCRVTKIPYPGLLSPPASPAVDLFLDTC